MTGGDALIVALIFACFTLIYAWSRLSDNKRHDDAAHHSRLMAELRRQPHIERDEYE